MRRRECVAAIGSTVGVAATAGMGRAGRTRTLRRRVPTGVVTAVRPGDAVVFEATADPGVEFAATDWSVTGYGASEDAADVRPHDPFLTYTGITGNPATRGRFEEAGRYRVTLSVGDRSMRWWVIVFEDAPAPPRIDVACDPGPDATVTVADEVSVTASVEDGVGRLDRLLWQEGRNATYLDAASVDGPEATVSYASAAGDALWFIGDYPMTGWVVCADGRVASASTDGPTVDPAHEVTITGTDSPVRAGEDLGVTAEIAVDGHQTYHNVVEVTADLIVGHDPTHDDSATVEVFAGERETVELGFTTAVVDRTQTFPVRVETAHGADEVDVTVYGTDEAGHLVVTDVETNAPVVGGEWLHVVATVENVGDAPVERDVALVVADDAEPIDARSVRVGPGEATTVELRYETYPVRNDDEFPIHVRTGDDAVTTTVLAYGRE